MTPTWYNTPERIAALSAAAEPWRGTPFRENSAVPGKGGGVSCHFLHARLQFSTGCLQRFEIPRGRVKDFLKYGPGDAMVAFIDAHLPDRYSVADGEPPLPGDLLVMRERETAKHIGTCLEGGGFVHVLLFSGVLFSRLADSTYQPLVAIRRPRP